MAGGWEVGTYTYAAGYWDLLREVCSCEQLAFRYSDHGCLTNGVVRVEIEGQWYYLFDCENTEAFYLLGDGSDLVKVTMLLEQLSGLEGWIERKLLPSISWDAVGVGGGDVLREWVCRSNYPIDMIVVGGDGS